jgi:hypothetical protein
VQSGVAVAGVLRMAKPVSQFYEPAMPAVIAKEASGVQAATAAVSAALEAFLGGPMIL